MYIAMNRFKVLEGCEEQFEKVWKERETHLDKVEGFKEFHLLKGEGGIYISHSTWESFDAFKAWTESENFKKAHAQGGSKGLLEGHPVFSGYDVVI